MMGRCDRCEADAEEIDGEMLTLPVNDGDGVMQFDACPECYNAVIGGVDESGEVCG